MTEQGAREFEQLTRTPARRGATADRPFHVVITVDGRVIARPWIDYRVNPSGLSGDEGMQIGLPNRSEAQKLARRLRDD